MLKRLLSAVLVVVMVFGIVAMAPLHVHAASEMKASDKIIDLIKTMEGFTAVPRWDYTQWTVGFGTRCPDEHLARYKAEGIPLEEAHALFMEHLVYFEDEVNAFMKRNDLELSQHQFDALVSMTYNLGSAFLHNSNHRATKAILSGAEGNDLIYAFTVSCTAGGEFLPGLMRRRLMEAVMYLQGVYNQHPAENYCYVLYDANGGTRDVVAQGFDCNLTAAPMSVPTYEGYTFLGWYTAPVGGVRIKALDHSMDGMTLYAHWQKGGGTVDLPVQPVDGVKVKVTGNSVNVRTGPGMDYDIVGQVVRNDELVITGVYEESGYLWGRFDRGWLRLDYTNYEEVISGGSDHVPDDPNEDNTHELPVDATVVASEGITIYNGPHTSYPKRGTLKMGEVIEVLEIITFLDVRWARFDGGWVQLNSKLLLHDDAKLAHDFQVTVIYSSVNVRSGPGTDCSIVTQVKKNTVLTVMAVVVVDGISWGRVEKGWIYLDGYTDYDPSKLPQYQNHSYGDWYVLEESDCITHGQEQRDCTVCDHSETRQLPLGDHTMGAWQDSREATCVTVGQQQRSCTVCDYSETRDTQLGDHTMQDWYLSLEPTCSAVGQERSDCVYCDHYVTRDVETIPHVFGNWYETKVPTVDEPGEARRDCQNCDHFETKVLDPTEHVFGDWFVYLAPTCTEDGEERRNCAHCELYESRPVSATGHTIGDWYVQLAPTCTMEGQECRDCVNCEYFESRELAATGHTIGDWYTHQMPTCTQEGQERRECASCEYYESRTIAATGHSLGDWYVHRESTVASYGEERRNCANCSHYESRQIEKMPAPVVKVYGTMTNASYFTLNIRSGAGSSYAVVGKLKYGTTVEILEEKTVGGILWGRTTAGWIQITNFITLDTFSVQAPQVRTRTYANVICELLNVRFGAGSNHAVATQLVNGATVEVYEFVTVSGEQWGRVDGGWIRIKGYVALNTYAEEVEGGHLHTYGEWETVQELSCTTDKIEHRYCVYCDYYAIRTTKTVGHQFGSWYVTQEPTNTQVGQECRDCNLCGHRETRTIPALGLESVTKTYGTMTSTVYTTINIRSGAGSSYSVVGLLKRGTTVEILETKTVSGILWGRTSVGWIWITDNVTLETITTEAEKLTYKTFGNVVCNGLNVRAGAGSNYSVVGSLVNGDVVEILEQKTVSGNVWGRIEGGWILLTGLVAVSDYAYAQGEQPHSHSFGAWSLVTDATCTQDGLESRSCTECGHVEERVVKATGHSYGQWYVTKEATDTEDGQQRRDCANCDHYEEETIPAQGVEMVTKIYGTMTNASYASLNIRSGAGYNFGVVGKLYYGERVEILEQKTVDGNVWGRIQQGWVLITGFMTLEEVREPVESVPPTAVIKEYGTMTNRNFASLNIRSGAGTGHSIVGKLYYGQRVEILEKKTVGNDVWGRIDGGWILLTGFVTLEVVSQ